MTTQLHQEAINTPGAQTAGPRCISTETGGIKVFALKSGKSDNLYRYQSQHYFMY
jgi:hypothetical protein